MERSARQTDSCAEQADDQDAHDCVFERADAVVRDRCASEQERYDQQEHREDESPSSHRFIVRLPCASRQPQCLANATATGLLQTEGYVTFLTVHEQGSGYGGGGTNFIDADVVFKLDSRPDKGFGFYLRNDDNQPIRQGMLDLVRDAMTHGLKVITDFTELVMPPNQNSFVLRVSLTKLPEPSGTLQTSLKLRQRG
jgi:hypothetical protein